MNSSPKSFFSWDCKYRPHGSFVAQVAAADSWFIEFNNDTRHSSPTAKEKKRRGLNWNVIVSLLTCVAACEHILIFWFQLKQISGTAHQEIFQTCLGKADNERTCPDSWCFYLETVSKKIIGDDGWPTRSATVKLKPPILLRLLYYINSP